MYSNRVLIEIFTKFPNLDDKKVIMMKMEQKKRKKKTKKTNNNNNRDAIAIRKLLREIEMRKPPSLSEVYKSLG